MHNSLQSFFLNFILFNIIFFFDSMFLNLMRNFLILENSSSFIFIFIKLNSIILFFLSSLKCFF